MISIKNGSSGGYVMPKLINLTLEQRQEQGGSLPRKGNPNLFLFAAHNE
jgi:hypothetical protein